MGHLVKLSRKLSFFNKRDAYGRILGEYPEVSKEDLDFLKSSESIANAPNPERMAKHVELTKRVIKVSEEMGLPVKTVLANMFVCRGIASALSSCINFVIENETANQLYNQPLNLAQDFNSTIGLPFKAIYLDLIDGVKIKRGDDNVDDTVVGLMVYANEGALVKLENMDECSREFFEEVLEMGKKPEAYNRTCEDDFVQLIFFYADEGETGLGFGIRSLPEFISFYNQTNLTGGKPSESILRLDSKTLSLGEQSASKLVSFAINLILFITSSNVQYVPYRGGSKSEYKRERKGLSPKKPEFYWCRIHYPSILEEKPELAQRLHVGYNHTFDVRGHFRYLQSNRFKNKRGMRVWISPFKKGHGIYVPKQYLVDWKEGRFNE